MTDTTMKNTQELWHWTESGDCGDYGNLESRSACIAFGRTEPDGSSQIFVRSAAHARQIAAAPAMYEALKIAALVLSYGRGKSAQSICRECGTRSIVEAEMLAKKQIDAAIALVSTQESK